MQNAIAGIVPGRELDNVHGNEYSGFDAAKIKEVSFDKLNSYLGKQQDITQNVARRIMGDNIRDRYVSTGAFRFGANKDAIQALIGGVPSGIVPHALDQVASRAGMNLRFLHDLSDKRSDWANTLAVHNLNEMVSHLPADERFLVRDIRGDIRGVMSAAYKRIDSRPTLISLLEEGEKISAKLVGGIYTDTRVSLKMVVAQPIEVFPNEWMVFGLDYSNSDFGNGACEFSSFLLRLRCLNGCVSVRELRKIHIGRRYEGDLGDISDRTLKLDAAAQASLAKDQVRNLLSPAASKNLVDQIRAAAEATVTPARIEGFLAKRLSKPEIKAVTEKFASADVVELPAGQNAWRLSNALSWLARDMEATPRKMELERMAGEAVLLGDKPLAI